MPEEIISNRKVFYEVFQKMQEIHGNSFKINPNDLRIHKEVSSWLNTQMQETNCPIEASYSQDIATGWCQGVKDGLREIIKVGNWVQTSEGLVYKIDLQEAMPQKVPFATLEKVRELYDRIKPFFSDFRF